MSDKTKNRKPILKVVRGPSDLDRKIHEFTHATGTSRRRNAMHHAAGSAHMPRLDGFDLYQPLQPQKTGLGRRIALWAAIILINIIVVLFVAEIFPHAISTVIEAREIGTMTPATRMW